MRYCHDNRNLEAGRNRLKITKLLAAKQFQDFECDIEMKQENKENIPINLRMIRNRRSMQINPKSDDIEMMELPTFGDWKNSSTKKHNNNFFINPCSRKSLNINLQDAPKNPKNTLALQNHLKQNHPKIRKPRLVTTAQKHSIYDSINKKDSLNQRKQSIEVQSQRSARKEILSANTSRSLKKQKNRLSELYHIQKRRYEKVVKKYGGDSNAHDQFIEFINQYA